MLRYLIAYGPSNPLVRKTQVASTRESSDEFSLSDVLNSHLPLGSTASSLPPDHFCMEQQVGSESWIRETLHKELKTQFVALENHTNSYLDCLLSRISHLDSCVSFSALILLASLLGLHCEDLSFYLIYRFLVPSKKKLKIDTLSESSDWFNSNALRLIRLIPSIVLFDRFDIKQQTLIEHKSSVELEAMDEMEELLVVFQNDQGFSYLPNAYHMVSKTERGCVKWKFPYNENIPTLEQVQRASINMTNHEPNKLEGLKLCLESSKKFMKDELEKDLDMIEELNEDTRTENSFIIEDSSKQRCANSALEHLLPSIVEKANSSCETCPDSAFYEDLFHDFDESSIEKDQFSVLAQQSTDTDQVLTHFDLFLNQFQKSHSLNDCILGPYNHETNR
ncbi:hypothetical protein Ciccas_011173, partial [Cichlidogyrus casuarinus]